MSTYYIIKNEYKIKTSTSGDYTPMLWNNTDTMHEQQNNGWVLWQGYTVW